MKIYYLDIKYRKYLFKMQLLEFFFFNNSVKFNRALIVYICKKLSFYIKRENK